MAEENIKYNTGIPMNVNGIKQEDLSLAISDWSEGNKHLQNAIDSCINNNIPTYASCAGHRLTDWPYLTMLVNKQNIGNILNIMDKISKQRNMRICLDLNILQYSGDDTRYQTALTIYPNMINKNKCFDMIKEASKSSINLEETSPIVQEIWNAHKSIRTHGSKYWKPSNSIAYRKKLFSSELETKLYIKDYTMERIFHSTNLVHESDEYNNRVYVQQAKTDELGKTLQYISQEVADTFLPDKEDEFYEEETTPHEEFKKSLKEIIDEKIISNQEKNKDEKDKDER